MYKAMMRRVRRGVYSMAWGVTRVPGVSRTIRRFAEPRAADVAELLAHESTDHENDDPQWPGAHEAAGSGVPARYVTQMEAAAGYVWDADGDAWVPGPSADADADAGASADAGADADARELRVVTFNVLFEGYDRWIPNVTRTTQRHAAILEWIVGSVRADVVVLEEVTRPCLRSILEHPGIRGRFRVSHGEPDAMSGLNVVVLVETAWPVLDIHLVAAEIARAGRSRRGVSRPTVVVRLVVPGGAVLAVGGIHLLASAKNVVQRGQEIRNLYRVFELGAAAAATAAAATAAAAAAAVRPGCVTLAADQVVLLGDANMHSPDEDVFVEAPYSDVWADVHGDEGGEDGEDAAGYTWDGVTNSVIAAMWLGCDKRRMRLDRVFTSTPVVAVPTQIAVTGKDRLANGLNMSDHYALEASFALQ